MPSASGFTGHRTEAAVSLGEEPGPTTDSPLNVICFLFVHDCYTDWVSVFCLLAWLGLWCWGVFEVLSSSSSPSSVFKLPGHLPVSRLCSYLWEANLPSFSRMNSLGPQINPSCVNSDERLHTGIYIFPGVGACFLLGLGCFAWLLFFRCSLVTFSFERIAESWACGACLIPQLQRWRQGDWDDSLDYVATSRRAWVKWNSIKK